MITVIIVAQYSVTPNISKGYFTRIKYNFGLGFLIFVMVAQKQGVYQTVHALFGYLEITVREQGRVFEKDTTRFTNSDKARRVSFVA